MGDQTRNDSYLLRGMDLQDALRWLAQAPYIKKQESSELQLEYIKASQEWEAGEIRRLQELNEEKERQRQEAERQRCIAVARELVSYALSSLADDPERSLLLSMHAVDVTRRQGTVLPDAEDLTHRALLASRIRLILSGHEDFVRSVAWSPDGKQLATASDDETVKVWDTSTGREVLTIAGHKKGAWSVAWSPDGERLAVAGGDTTAQVWEAGTGRNLLTLSDHKRFESVAWSPDGKHLATGSGDQTAKVWDATNGRTLMTFSGHKDSVECVTWSPDGKRLATGSGDQTAKVWDVATGREVLTLAAAHLGDSLLRGVEPEWAAPGHGDRRHDPQGNAVGHIGTRIADPKGSCQGFGMESG